MNIPDLIQFCPRCGRQAVKALQGKAIQCDACGFLLFFNAATAVGALISDAEGRLLLLRRSRDPGKGKFGLPGGFVDAGESAEEALRREVREETNLEVNEMRYLCSRPNRYEYQGVTYHTEDLFFLCTVQSFDSLAALDETESCCFLRPEEIQESDFAFPTAWQALCLSRSR